MKSNGVNTRCVHAGGYRDKISLAINTPIYASTAHIYPNEADELRYPRYHNLPTMTAVARKIAMLENAEEGLVFGSGMAAITTVLFAFMKKGDHAVFQSGLYGGTQSFVMHEMGQYGFEVDIIDSTNVEDYNKAIKDNTVLVYIESPTNPLMSIMDLAAVAKMARERSILSVIDNTFATPVNQSPIDLGIDVAVHSGTKYLNGHSDVNCGAVVTSKKLMVPIYDCFTHLGAVLDVHACYQLERGLKTLGLRVARQNENGMRIAKYLDGNDRVKQVYYPGLESHAGHEIAARQMRGFGGMLSFELDSDKAGAKRFEQALKLITPAISLGGVETILTFPCETSHAKLSKEERKRQGITDSLIRLSVGIEDISDLQDDLEQAIKAI